MHGIFRGCLTRDFNFLIFFANQFPSMAANFRKNYKCTKETRSRKSRVRLPLELQKSNGCLYKPENEKVPTSGWNQWQPPPPTAHASMSISCWHVVGRGKYKIFKMADCRGGGRGVWLQLSHVRRETMFFHGASSLLCTPPTLLPSKGLF